MATVLPTSMTLPPPIAGDDTGTVLTGGSDTRPGQLDRGLAGHREHRGQQPQPGQQTAVASGAGAPCTRAPGIPARPPPRGSSAARPGPAMIRPAAANSKVHQHALILLHRALRAGSVM